MAAATGTITSGIISERLGLSMSGLSVTVGTGLELVNTDQTVTDTTAEEVKGIDADDERSLVRYEGVGLGYRADSV